MRVTGTLNRTTTDARHTSQPHRAMYLLNLPALVVVVMANVLALLTVSTHFAPIARADEAKLNIIVPHPSDSRTEGPVGTNVTISATGLTPGGSYTLGYARADVGCVAGFQAFQNMTENADSNGAFTATISWPESLNAVGTSYRICAKDAAKLITIPIQSLQTFRVDAGHPPSIDVAPAAQATPGASTPTSPTPPDGSYYQGSALAVTGHNFFPGGATFLVTISATALQQAADFQSAAQHPLGLADGGQNISQSSGSISATALLPSNLAPGNYTLYVMSTDGSDQAVPSLVASKPISIIPAPTPVPTATATHPAATASASGTPSGDSSTGPKNLGAVIVLATLSIVLFIAGVVALLSATTSPGPGHQ